MINVYVVEEEYWSDHRGVEDSGSDVLGVFDSLEKAIEYIQQLRYFHEFTPSDCRPNRWDYEDDYDYISIYVTEWELNKGRGS